MRKMRLRKDVPIPPALPLGNAGTTHGSRMEERAVLCHCTAGKERTGVPTAVFHAVIVAVHSGGRVEKALKSEKFLLLLGT